ncbi:Na+/H+ antiporter NhaC family protein [Flavobacterium sp. NKUCC04_CG]|uniref:Na+/H+ antiporter NhaC family protein n=1 Tax=Flavobacterium sp. NKUCC04_CG TaxID=2842121 RepID=UPI001C5B8E16|nr:Na+/H+ antiporter NhaC family protein [Flavobacterium sp. NKUCC04_CG]MBW3518582.1 Na+/H+ antiporter NhaC family protein [Flavobacterium sp. NKUCC04_CG]
MKITNKAYSLFPFLVFISVFLGAGIYLDDFYKLPSPVAVIAGVVMAFIMFRIPLTEKINHFIAGCGDSKIITMCVIYLLAGAFATVTKAIGGVDLMVHWGLSYIPIQYLPLGIFLIACFLSLSIGTSVGAIVALGPIVIGLADQSGISLGLVCGSLLAGSMFGDNLSLISDTTIAATQTIGCEMKDKFKANSLLAIPAAILCCFLLYFLSMDTVVEPSVVLTKTVNLHWSVLLPYVLVILLSVLGLHVFIVLTLSIVVAGVIGALGQSMDVIVFSNLVYSGFLSMIEIFLLSMFTGGLASMVEKQGGIQYLLTKMQTVIRNKKSALWGIGFLVSSVNMAVANNTVAILISGNLVKDIASRYQISKPKAASVLDIFACVVQGLLPYGAQVLILLSFTAGKLDYLDLVKNAYYLYFLLIITAVSITMSNNKKKGVEAENIL